MSDEVPVVDVIPCRWRKKNVKETWARRRSLLLPKLEHPRFCRTCRKEKEQEEFSSYKRGDKRYWHTRCNPCRSRVYLAGPTCRAKKELILNLRSGTCIDCREDHPGHINHFVIQRGAPLFHVEHAWSGRSVKAIKEEVKKYGIVCSNCYAERKHQANPDSWMRRSKLADLPPELAEQVGHI